MSTPFFVLFGLLFLCASAGFWQYGKSEIARAYILPTLVAGLLLIIIGTGLFFNNRNRLATFPTAYGEDPAVFVTAELDRTAATLQEYQTVVFTIIPLLIAGFAVGIVLVASPAWRAGFITAIAMLVVLLLVDGTAHGRMAAYQEQLRMVEEVPVD